MKLKKLIDRINEFADSDQSDRKKQNQRLKKTLKALKKKYIELCESRQNEADPMQREALENKIKIVQTQRKKGIALRKGLKKTSGKKRPEE